MKQSYGSKPKPASVPTPDTVVSLTVNNRTFIIKSKQMIDWAIDGMMEVEDAGVFNILQDAMTEFHYQLFKSEHKSYYGEQDLEILDECRTVANVGWLRKLPPNEPRQIRPPPAHRQGQPRGDRHLKGVHRRLHEDTRTKH